MKNKPEIKLKIVKLFEKAKDHAGCQNIVEKAKKLYCECDVKSQWQSDFIDVLKYCFVHPDKLGTDRMLTFVAKFASALYAQNAIMDDNSADDDEEPFVSSLLDFISQIHCASDHDVRLRCITLVNYFLSYLPESSCLHESRWNGLSEIIKKRLKDRNLNVRVAAVLVAHKLQENKNPRCEIVKLLSFHMRDPAADVRRAVISSIAITRRTITDIIARTLDVNDNVRRNAYAVIAKIPLKYLTIEQRVALLQRGLNDRIERVRDCVEKILLRKWLDAHSNKVLALVKELDVINSSDTALLALKSLIRWITLDTMMQELLLNEQHILQIPLEDLSPEIVLLWRFLAFHAHENKLEVQLDSLLPDISPFVDLIKGLFSLFPSAQSDNMTNEIQWALVKRKRIIIHLLEMTACFDMSDEVGRLNLELMCKSMLLDNRVECQLVPYLLDVLLVTSLNKNILPTTINILAQIRNGEEEERSDLETVSKCLKILNHSILISGVKKISPELWGQLQFVVECLSSTDLLTQSLSIEVLAKYCILDLTVAENQLQLFLKMVHEIGENEINVLALKAVFDIIQIHGNLMMRLQDETDKQHEDVLSWKADTEKPNSPVANCLIVTEEMLRSSQNDEIKLTVFEGFCKLLATGVVHSPCLLETVIIKGFTPIRGSEAEDRIRQIFMVFFTLFSRYTPRSQEMIQAAFIPVLRKLNQAHVGTPESDINALEVAKFLIEHTKADGKSSNVHNDLSLLICHAILRDFTEQQETDPDPNYLRCLLRLNLTPDSNYLEKLNSLLTKIKRETKNNASLRQIDKVVKWCNSHSTTSNSTTLATQLNNQSHVAIPLPEMVENSIDDYSIANSASDEKRPKEGFIVPESPEILSE